MRSWDETKDPFFVLFPPPLLFAILPLSLLFTGSIPIPIHSFSFFFFLFPLFSSRFSSHFPLFSGEGGLYL